MLNYRVTRNVFLVIAFVLLGLGLYQSRPRSVGNGTVRIFRQSPPVERLMLQSMVFNAVGSFAGTQPEIQNAAFYQKPVAYRGEVHQRAGGFSYCGQISTMNLPGIHARFRGFAATVWLSFDGTPLPDPENEASFALLDNPDDPTEHARFAAQATAMCRNEILPVTEDSVKPPVTDGEK